MKTPDNETYKKLAKLQLGMAILEGKEWAVKHALGLPDISVGGDNNKWKLEVTHVTKDMSSE